MCTSRLCRNTKYSVSNSRCQNVIIPVMLNNINVHLGRLVYNRFDLKWFKLIVQWRIIVLIKNNNNKIAKLTSKQKKSPPNICPNSTRILPEFRPKFCIGNIWGGGRTVPPAPPPPPRLVRLCTRKTVFVKLSGRWQFWWQLYGSSWLLRGLRPALFRENRPASFCMAL